MVERTSNLVRASALALIREQPVMTVSVADLAGRPWAITTLYANDGFLLYWPCDRASKAHTYLLDNPAAIVTVLGTGRGAGPIRSVVIEGAAGPVEDEVERERAAALYRDRHPEGARRVGLADARGAVQAADGRRELFRFTPHACWYTDHRLGFSHRVDLHVVGADVALAR